MLFWIICFLLSCAVAAMIIAPMVRPPAARADDPQVALYKAQLAEVDRDVARDVLAADEADRARTEIARRLLAASSQENVSSRSPIAKPVVFVVIIGLIGGAVGTYRWLGAPGYPDLPRQTRIALGDEARANRPTQDLAEAAAPVLPQPDVPEDYLASVEQLREVVPLRPDDLQGWELLAYHEAQLRNYAAAADAQARVVELRGESVATADQVLLADLLVTAANGFISPEAEDVVRAILQRDPENIAARYYLGALFDQTDRPDRALQLWRSILESGTAETYHIALARQQVSNTAFRAGVSYTPPDPQDLALEDMLGAEDLDPETRAEMIDGMIARLADRLATQGGPVSQWARLIVAYGVVGRTEDATAILAEARDVFGASDAALAVLSEAATRAGLDP